MSVACATLAFPLAGFHPADKLHFRTSIPLDRTRGPCQPRAMTGGSGADGQERRGGVAAVDRAIAILRAVGAAEGPATLAALAAATGFHKSTILRLAASLEAGGMLMRDPDGRFRLGPALLDLGTRFQDGAAPAELLMPAMRALALLSGESVAFYVPAGPARVCLHRVESPQALRYTVHVGAVLPLDRGSGGRVLAAHLGAGDALHAAVRARGFHHSDGERDPQVAGVSVPVLRAGGGIAGALTIAGPRQRLTPARVAEILPALREAGAALTRALGGAAPL